MNFNIIYPKITLNQVNKYSQEKLDEFKVKVDETWAETHNAYKKYMQTSNTCDFWGDLAILALVIWFAIGIGCLIFSNLTLFIVVSVIASLICVIHIVTAIIKINDSKKIEVQFNEALDFVLKILDTYSIYPVLDKNTAWRNIIKSEMEQRPNYSDSLDAWKIILWSKGAEYYDETLKNIETLQQIGLNNITYSNISITNDYELFCPCAVLTETLNNYTLTRYNLYLSKVYEDLGSAKNVIRTVLEKPNEVNIDLGYLDDVFAKCNKSDGFTPNITEESRRICAEILTRI